MGDNVLVLLNKVGRPRASSLNNVFSSEAFSVVLFNHSVLKTPVKIKPRGARSLARPRLLNECGHRLQKKTPRHSMDTTSQRTRQPSTGPADIVTKGKPDGQQSNQTLSTSLGQPDKALSLSQASSPARRPHSPCPQPPSGPAPSRYLCSLGSQAPIVPQRAVPAHTPTPVRLPCPPPWAPSPM